MLSLTYELMLNSLLSEPPTTELPVGQTASRTITAGGNLTLSVSISGFNLPLTSITWRHQGEALTGSEDGVIITNTPTLPVPAGLDPVISTLQLKAIVPRGSGSYTLTATNDAGHSNLQFSISVTGRYMHLSLNCNTLYRVLLCLYSLISVILCFYPISNFCRSSQYH